MATAETAITTNPHRQVSSTLPNEVVACLRNARFLHLATCDALYPHVSLMNYTYLPSSPYSSHPTIIMTTDPSSKKTLNMIRNPRVALLVHDWVSHRPPSSSTTTTTRTDHPPSTQQAATAAPRSSLASLLLNLNTSALSSISATINGIATLIEAGTEQETYFKQKHIENNTFDDQYQYHQQAQEEEDDDDEERGRRFGGDAQQQQEEEEDGGRSCYIEGDQVRVVAVRVIDGRIADWKGGVKDWAVVDSESDHVHAHGAGLPNGV